jgi:hypothetical protein
VADVVVPQFVDEPEPEVVEDELLLQAVAASVTAAAAQASLAMRCIGVSAFCEVESGLRYFGALYG